MGKEYAMKAVDLFSGAGGFSLGAQMAGLEVVWAANHWRAAVDCHSQAIPGAHHECQDLQQCNWLLVPDHDVMLASPCCQGHSKARGKDRPAHDSARSTAWAVVSAAEVKRPQFLIVENVPEFMRWELYPVWRSALERLGYSICENVHDAADSGVPQHRVRLFVVCKLGRHVMQPFETFKRTFGQPAADSILLPIRPTTPVSSLCEATRRRVREGRKRFGRRFLISYYGTERGGRSTQMPLGTVTTRDRHALVDGSKMRMLTVDEYRGAMGFPKGFPLPKNKKLAKHLLGNAVPPPLAMDVIKAAISI
jgi:DNA (cytosine-5)-methyltransferase 1